MVELQSVVENMQEIDKRLNNAIKVLFKYAKSKAETERIYRTDLAQEIMRLRAEGLQAVLIADVARGSVAEEKFNRDLSDSQYRVAIESIEALRAQLNALQSILRYQSEM
jgi:hypothetical protein